MSTLWKHAYDVSQMPSARHFAPADDENALSDEVVRNHERHAIHPWLTDAGIKESPCGMPSCPHYDEGYLHAMMHGDESEGRVETHEPGSIELHGMESHIDPATVIRYMNEPPDPTRPLPHVTTWRGQHHIQDGHHRLLADIMRGRPMTFRHTHVEDQ